MNVHNLKHVSHACMLSGKNSFISLNNIPKNVVVKKKKHDKHKIVKN